MSSFRSDHRTRDRRAGLRTGRFERWRLGLLAVCLTATCTGCGGRKSDAPPVAPVTGKITRKGEPLPSARVTFTPQGLPMGEAVIPSFAVTDESGRYTLLFNRDLQGALIARHRVQVVKDPAYDDDGRPLKTGVIVPPQYNSQSQLEVAVPPEGLSGGTADIDLDF